MRYRADPPGARRTIACDGVTLIYHRPSGMTHVVASPVPQILEALSDRALDVDGLRARLPADWDLDETALPLLEARLAELLATGLVRPA